MAVVTHEGHEEVQTFSQKLACTYCGLSFDELAPRNFSFNSPYGACPTCDGLGTRWRSTPSSSSRTRICPSTKGPSHPGRRTGSSTGTGVLQAVADAHGFDLDTPWKKLTKKARDILLVRLGRADLRHVQEPVREAALVLHDVRGHHPQHRTALRARPKSDARSGEARAVHARDPLPRLQRPASQAGDAWRSRSAGCNICGAHASCRSVTPSPSSTTWASPNAST